ncbi:MAG: type secretion system protein [Burkholderiaceae bacterium]|nr:type secretion system protein [Burkholderiaceae bacterium]
MSAGSEGWQQFRQRCSAYWMARAPRERLMLSVAVAVVIIGLLYALLVDSALSGREKMEKRLPQLRQQAALMQGLAREAAALSAKPATPSAAVSKQGIEASLAGRALRVQSVAIADGVVRLRLPSVTFAGLTGWLDEAQKSMRLTVVEATVVALEQPGMVDATLTLRQPKD